MSRRRYISTTISTDKIINQLAREYGDFAALLYTWMIPHADDAAFLTGDPEELLMMVCPGMRHRTEGDVVDALRGMDNLGLIAWDGEIVYFDSQSFYRHQSYIQEAKRVDNSAHFQEQRETPRNAAKRRETPRNAASLSLSLSPSLSALAGPESSTDVEKVHVSASKHSAAAVFEEVFWPQWPTSGAKKLARQRFLAASAKERQRILTAEKHYITADSGGVLNFTVRAENFIGGQKSYYEEWADGPPPAGSNWYKRGSAPIKSALDLKAESDLKPWQRYCLAWFDEGGWHAQWCRGMTEEEDKGLRDAVEEGRLSRADVIAGRHPCSQ